jgi:hypothetical protein
VVSVDQIDKIKKKKKELSKRYEKGETSTRFDIIVDSIYVHDSRYLYFVV